MLDYSPFMLPLTDPVAVFGLVMLILVAAPLLAARARIPGMIGIILAGAVFGPSGLEVLVRDNTIELLGTVGLLYLLFAAALDMDLRQLVKLKFRSLTFATLSFSIPMGLAIYFGLNYMGLDLLAALLVGSVIGTHTLLAYPIVQHLGLTKRPAVVMTVGGSIATDTLGLLVLAAVMRSAAGEGGLLFWGSFVGVIVLYLVVVLRGVPALGRWFFRSFPNQPAGELAFLLAVLFTVAMGAQLVGLAPIVGAFLAGLALNRLIPPSSPLMSRLKYIGNSLFIPFFLLSVGMLVDFRVLIGGLTVWITAAWLVAMLAVGKFAAAMITQRIFGHTMPEGWIIFGLSFPQAAAALAVTLIGYEYLGLFDLEMVNAVVVLILVSCMVGPSVLERFGRQAAQEAEKEPPAVEDAPQRLLVPLSNPATAGYLMDIALAIRDEDHHQPIYPLAVAPDTPNVEAEVARSEKLLVHAVAQGVAAGVQVTPITRVDFNIADGILRAVRELRISTIIIGWNGELSARERIFGTVLDRLLENTDQETLVCKLDHPLNTAQRIVLMVPPLAHLLNGFEEAVHTMKTLARQLSAKLIIIVTESHVAEVTRIVEKVKPEAGLEFVPVRNWGGVLDATQETIESDELIVLLSAREQTLAWYRGLNRLPRRIVTRFPKNNFIAIYPAEEHIYYHTEAGTVPQHERQTDPLLAGLKPSDIAIGTEGIGPESALGKAVIRAIGSDPAQDSPATTRLFRSLEESAVQLKADVVLLHSPYPGITGPKLLIGMNREGFEVRGMAEPVHLVYVLLSPPGLPPERHLADLSRLARLLPDKESVERLIELDTPESVIEELNRQSG